MGVAHRFGGDWTEQKLEVLAKYLTAYTTVLSKQSFERIYIDAFAGTGSRQSPRREDQAELFPPEFLDGSARIALKTEPRFHRYIFVEESGERCEQLEALKAEFPDRAGGIEVIKGDANKEVQDICGWDWRNCRAALFLDPYGMEVEWATIEADPIGDTTEGKPPRAPKPVTPKPSTTPPPDSGAKGAEPPPHPSPAESA